MKFELIEWITNPFVLMFFAISIGILLGRLRLGSFSLGTSGPLFTGLLIGWLVVNYGKSISKGEAGYSAVQNMLSGDIIPQHFFTLSLIFFIASVGLLAAKDIGAVIKKYGLKFIALGIMITFIGALVSFAIIHFNPVIDTYAITGVYTGTLTSSPGLAAALEASRKDAASKIETMQKNGAGTINEDEKNRIIREAEASTGAGYMISYPFGVFLVILFVNIFPSIFGIDINREVKKFSKEMKEIKDHSKDKKVIKPVTFDLPAFMLVCFLGFTLGQLEFNLGRLGYLGIGTTGGVLILSLLLGYLGKVGPFTFRMESKILEIIRDISISFFLCIIGLRYGYNIFNTSPHLFFSAMIIGVLVLLSGYFIGRYLFKINWTILSGAVCGGMTSTPGLGAAIEALDSDGPVAGYGAIYPFALLGMVVFSSILPRLVM